MIELFLLFLCFFLFFTAGNQTGVMIALSFFLFEFVYVAHSSRYYGYYNHGNQGGKSFEKLWVLSLLQQSRKFRSEVKWEGLFQFGPTGMFRTTSRGGSLRLVGPKFAVPVWQTGSLPYFFLR